MVEIGSRADVQVQAADADAVLIGPPQAIVKLLVPNAVLRLLAPRVGLLAVPVAEARIDSASSIATIAKLFGAPPLVSVIVK